MCKPENRDFKGIWIPKNLYLDRSITWTAKLLLIEIDSLDNGNGCFASNAHLADFIGVSHEWVKRLIGELKEAGVVTVTEHDGQRFIKLNQDPSQHNDGPGNHIETQDNGEVEVPPGADIRLTAEQEESVQVIYDFWNSFKGHPSGKWHEHTKVSYAIRSAVVQNFDLWSVEQICQAIENYALVLLSPDHFWDYTWNLSSFLTSERSGGDKKWWQFLPENFDEAEYHGAKPKVKTTDEPLTIPEDKNLEVTKRLIKMYCNMTNSQRFEPSPKQTVQFIDAAAKMVTFFSAYPTVIDPENFKMLRGALEKAYIERGEILNVGNLCSKYTWDTLLPQSMRELGYIE